MIKQKRVILFDALTKFIKKQALMGVNELIGYYSKKYKKVNHKQNKGAHVIGNYANGAKVRTSYFIPYDVIERKIR